MDKSELIVIIRDAREEHIALLETLKSLVNAYPVDQNDFKLKVDSCVFGHWFYNGGKEQLRVFHNPMIEQIEGIHKQIHYEYEKIYNLYFDVSDHTLLQKIFKVEKRVSLEDKTKAVNTLKCLEKLSEDLIKYFNIIETKISVSDIKKI